MKQFFVVYCKWYSRKDGLCNCPHKDRSKRTDVIAGQTVDVTWNGRCTSEETAIQCLAGIVTPPLACDDAEEIEGVTRV